MTPNLAIVVDIQYYSDSRQNVSILASDVNVAMRETAANL